MIDLTPYIQGTYDIVAFQGVRRDGRAQLDPSLVDETNNANITTGLYKLTQRFLLRLLTGRGSMRYTPSEGAGFVQKLQQGRLNTRTAVFSAFAIAESQIAAQFARERLETDQPDEQYLRATLVNVEVSPGSAILTVRVHSRAEPATVILPIATIV